MVPRSVGCVRDFKGLLGIAGRSWGLETGIWGRFPQFPPFVSVRQFQEPQDWMFDGCGVKGLA